MYNDIGKKIKGLATVICVITAILFVVAGIIFMVLGDIFVFVGLLIMVAGALFSWISSWLLYGFGELIDKTCDIERNTRASLAKHSASVAQSNGTAIETPFSPGAKEKFDILDRYYAQGKISEEDYQMQRANILNNQ